MMRSKSYIFDPSMSSKLLQIKDSAILAMPSALSNKSFDVKEVLYFQEIT